MKKEIKYQIPQIIKEIMQTISESGFSSFIVGGYVRDLLLGKPSYDIDISTNAPFSILKKLFKGKQFEEYASIHLKKDNYNIDITTFREELEYKNNKPTKIIYTNKLYNDLLRRDFTINTLVIDINGNLIDLLGALNDLQNKKIKVVGSTYDRLDEDNTRILRAIRLASILNFELDNEIKCYLKEKSNNLSTLTKEYIKDELDKIFKENTKIFFDVLNKYNLSKHLYISFNQINTKVSSPYAIWAQLETSLPLRREEKTYITSIKKIIQKPNIEKIDIYKYGEQISLIASEIKGQSIENLIQNMPIKTIFDIDITFNEIKEITNTNNINKVYKDLEKQILSDKLKNEKETIINYLRGTKYE